MHPMIDDPAVASALDALAPPREPDVAAALRRQKALQRAMPNSPFGMLRAWRAHLAVPNFQFAIPIAAALVAVILIVTPVRGLAAQFLAVFRVEDVQPITIDQLSQPLPDLRQLGDMSPSPRDIRPQLTRVANLAAVSSQVGFTVAIPSQLPSGLPSQPSAVGVTNGASVNFTFRKQKAQQYLSSSGHGNVVLPDKFDGATLHLQVYPAAAIAFLSAGASVDELQQAATAARASGKPEASVVNALLNGNGLLMMETKSPELDVSGVSADELRSFLLSLPLPESTKVQLQAIGDWKSTLPIPAMPGSSLHKVSINGAPGVAGKNGSATMVLWVNNGIVYAAAGPKLDEHTLISVAQSVK
jgi:hypothetical protein